MDSCPWHLQGNGKASRRGSLIRLTATLIVAGQCSTACQPADVGSRRIHAGFAFEGLTPASVGVVSDRLSAPLTLDDLRTIESAALRELHIAFANTRLQFNTSHRYAYRVRVVPQLVSRRARPAAGESFSFGGTLGSGAVAFNIVALSALAYAPAGTDHATIVHAIGRGIGRTAVHEFAHQILGPAAMDGTADLFSYEHADLRAEHFFAQLHWGPAAVRLRQRIGLRPHR